MDEDSTHILAKGPLVSRLVDIIKQQEHALIATQVLSNMLSWMPTLRDRIDVGALVDSLTKTALADNSSTTHAIRVANVFLRAPSATSTMFDAFCDAGMLECAARITRNQLHCVDGRLEAVRCLLFFSIRGEYHMAIANACGFKELADFVCDDGEHVDVRVMACAILLHLNQTYPRAVSGMTRHLFARELTVTEPHLEDLHEVWTKLRDQVARFYVQELRKDLADGPRVHLLAEFLHLRPKESDLTPHLGRLLCALKQDNTRVVKAAEAVLNFFAIQFPDSLVDAVFALEHGEMTSAPFAQVVSCVREILFQKLLNALQEQDSGEMRVLTERLAHLGLHDMPGSWHDTVARATAWISTDVRRETLGINGLEVPTELTCPITLCLFKEPVMASDGHTYEKNALESLFAHSGESAQSPMTRETLDSTVLMPNFVVRKMVDGFRERDLRVAELACAKEKFARSTCEGSVKRVRTSE